MDKASYDKLIIRVLI